MKRLATAILLILASCGGNDEETAAKDRAAAAAHWALILKIDGIDVRLPLEGMNVLLFKDEDYASQNPTVFEVQGKEISLIGEIPPSGNPGYGEKWEKMIGTTLTLKASGEFHRDIVDSKLLLPGKGEVQVTGGTMTPEAFSGKWSGSNGDKTLKGRIKLQLRDGRTLEGTFAVHVVTWG